MTYSNIERRQPSYAEKAFAIVVILLSTGAFLNVGKVDVTSAEAGMPFMQALWALVYVLTFVFIWKHCKGISTRFKQEFWLVALVLLTLSSTLWSDSPSLSLRRATALLCTTVFGFYFAMRYSPSQQLRLVGLSLLMAATASVFCQLLGIGRSVDEGVPGWIGVYTQKNQLGSIMALASAALLVLRRSDARVRSWASLGIVVTLALLLLSRSATALVVFASVMITLALRSSLRKSYRAIFASAAILCPLAIWTASWVLHNLDIVTEWLGRDVTLTGRVELWILSVVMALQRPWFGYGYDAFWRGGQGASAAIWNVLSWDPPHSHNGLLELWLDIGWVGIALFLITFFVYLRRALVFLRKNSNIVAIWPLVFLVLLFVTNLTEANLVTRNNVFWLLYVATGVSTQALAETNIDVRREAA